MKQLTSWGKYPVIDSEVYTPESQQALMNEKAHGIGRGLGRSYGDSALSERVIESGGMNHFIAFDNVSGELTCEAGVSLADILTVFVPKGWFLPVTPGTKFVTVGGAIASDVHGKNHHVEGTFCNHVTSLTLVIGEQEFICSRDKNSDLFFATCGGMGLTGVITRASFILKPIKSAFIKQQVIKAKNLSVVLELFERHHKTTYSVAWIDCLSTGENLGRSLLMLGEHSESGKLSTHREGVLNIPFDLPSQLLNKYTVQIFNAAYSNKQVSEVVNTTVHYDSFFFPLDRIHNWNRMYGKQGFTQYQFVIPKSAGREGLKEVLEAIAESKQGSFLAVLKVFGQGNENLLSFPMEGYTLALDFKITNVLFELLDRLDVIVRKYGGRLYLSKDVRMPEDVFKVTYPQWKEFQKTRNRYGADDLYHSLQSKRIGL
ncbi:FAD-binding oxidoreductase [Vibrio paucivorans]|uniref:FAD-binding oxidoreductase n=1 Tax=Vibrio paucivorans TaxID=2829489 RepID=A0A9X3CHW2_9VIBR|nr:FAD-binding oxidoreductase [Vibrio paucivorans]MCW8336198.1 FAD-binding oxidoreductase [Vibrio paucivorans]